MSGDHEGAERSFDHFSETRWWLRELARFADEVRIIHRQQVVPAMEHRFDSSPFNLTLRAYVMHCFAWIDLASRYYSRSDDQTQRMAAFLRRYMGLDGRTALVVVNLWRHPLAHGPFPRPWLDRPADADRGSSRVTDYWPLLSWQTTDEEHLRFRADDPDDQEDRAAMGDMSKRHTMDLGLLNLVAGVSAAIATYVEELDTDPTLQANYRARWNALFNASFA